jgi:DNA-binding transcriptional ArsR family regulator
MATQTIDAFQAIADPSRRQILLLLSQEKQTINSLVDNFDISRPAVSKHIKLLQLSGFITIEDVGRERVCALNEDGFKEVQQWINFFDAFWKGKMKKLGTALNNKKQSSKKTG